MQKSTTIIGVLTMLEDGYSYRDIQARYCVGNSTITDLKRKFEGLNVPLNFLSIKSSKEIESLFYNPSHSKKDIPLPNFHEIYKLITDKKRNVNLYFLWIEYKKQYPNGYQYTQFNKLFRKWLEENNLISHVSMAVERLPGHTIYIDWVGDTLPLVLDNSTGELKEAHFFVTTVGVSSYCFAMAFPDEKVDSFLRGTVEALEFYGALPKILKPDNTKAAVIKNNKDSLILNRIYEDIQAFYDVPIVPTPPRKPKGKPTVEEGVKWLETHLLEKLRGRWFSTFNDLNMEILDIITELNLRPYNNGKGNRLSSYLEFDKPVMRPLPSDSFTLSEYKVKTVPSNYHLEYDGHYYSVPFSYYKQEVTLKVSAFDIKICDERNRLICTHKRLYKAFPKYSTVESHMPPHHQYYHQENIYDGQAYRNWAKNIGEPVYLFICRVIASFQYEEQSYKSCNAILQMCKGVPKTYANAAAKECIDSHIHNYSHFKKTLNKMMNHESEFTGELPQHKNIRGKDNYK